MLVASGNSNDGLIGVDRETNTIKGVFIARSAVFANDGAVFDTEGLSRILELWSESGIVSRFGKRSPWVGQKTKGGALGSVVRPWIDDGILRADLILNPTSFDTPIGDIGNWLLSLAESEPGRLATSLALNYREVTKAVPLRRSVASLRRSVRMTLWKPHQLHALDLVESSTGRTLVEMFRSSDQSILPNMPDWKEMFNPAIAAC